MPTIKIEQSLLKWIQKRHGAEHDIERINDVQAVEPKTVALACPFCMTMISDGIKEKNLDLKIKVKDITEIIADNLKD